MKSKLFTCSLALALLVSAGIRMAFAEPENKPNILFILADDLTFEALGATSKGAVVTPNLDRLRDQGCSFSHAINPGSWTPAVCQASRTMLETGKSVWKAQKFNPQKDKSSPLWSRLMKQAGYETYFVGKWHVAGITPDELFDHVGTVRGGMPKQSADGYNRRFLPGKKDRWTPDDKSYGGYWEGGRHWSEVVADETCGFIKKASARKPPFFIYVAFNAPHDPRQSAPEYQNLYPVGKIEMPKAFLPEYPYNSQIGAGRQLRDERLSPFPRTELSVKTNRKEYYSIITHLDEQIGRILAELQKNSKAPVYIIFTSDQGLSVGDHGFMGKQNLYDPSIRVPFIIKGPGIKAGATIDTPIYLQSIMPTCLEISGLPKQEQIIYPSLLPELKSGRKTESCDMYGAMLNLQRMILTDQWKMLVYPKAGIVRLYNRINDPHEMKEVAGIPDHIPVMNDLFSRLQKLQQWQDDALDLKPVYGKFITSIQK